MTEAQILRLIDEIGGSVPEEELTRAGGLVEDLYDLEARGLVELEAFWKLTDEGEASL